MEPSIQGRLVCLDVHCPPARDQNALVTAITIKPPMTSCVVPWLRHLFHLRLGGARVRFAGGGVGHIFVMFFRPEDQERVCWLSPFREEGRRLSVFPHNRGENSFSFFYRYLVYITLEKFPLEFWHRRGVASCLSGFANLVNIDHACLHGHEFAAIFVMIKVEALDHIPHHLAFHKADETGIMVDIFTNEI
ncbi:hypothetical protein E2562_030584 [Oryza meyeriana var. granulata]|uniref:Uncharacterized protein n=1 Tax=Oryza meyeriana var. granulata TaxID=110450 RepID=A0A6G1ER86_9ORYZ|nr:hypothetical protein E2562_030584 [Oryza meyeriana var. granulata]